MHVYRLALAVATGGKVIAPMCLTLDRTLHLLLSSLILLLLFILVSVDEDEAETAIAGILVSVFGASCSFLLWAYKRHYGAVLRSMVLLAVRLSIVDRQE